MVFPHQSCEALLDIDTLLSVLYPLEIGIQPDAKKTSTIVTWLKKGITGRYDKVLTIPMPPKHQECEYAVPFDRAVNALQAFRDLIHEHFFIFTLPVEIRTVARDSNMLSPSFETDVCYIGAYTAILAGKLFSWFVPLMKSFGGRPHWGKHFSLTQEEASRMYPRFHDFKRIRKEFDPDGLFLNDSLRALFA